MFYTEEALGENLGLDDMDKISHLDILPEDIAGQLADSAARNNLIVKTYKENQDIYGQTIVFAVNVIVPIVIASPVAGLPFHVPKIFPFELL